MYKLTNEDMLMYRRTWFRRVKKTTFIRNYKDKKLWRALIASILKAHVMQKKTTM